MTKSTHRRTAKLKETREHFDQIRTSQGLYPAVAELAQTVTQWLFFRGDCFLVTCSLQELAPIVQPVNELVLKQVQLGDFHLLTTMKTTSDTIWHKMLLERERSCVVALKDEQPVAYGWFTPKVDPRVERTYVPLSRDEIFIFDLFTRPAFRRQGIQSALLRHILELGQKKGYKRALSLIAVTNTPSLNLHEKLGFQTICRFTRIRVLGWVRFSFHPNPFGKAGNLVRWL
ncbi:MAG: GNAT family N-acetyltransferase [Chloroflexi bacterium]|nr:GNAT family N-acetyltransferase [Chloroflexota bacterium]